MFFFMPHPSAFSYSMGEARKSYSVRSAITGSFRAAACAGMSPEMRVSATLTHTMIKAVSGGSDAMPAIPESEKMIALMIPLVKRRVSNG